MGTTTKQAVAVEGELRRIAVSRIRVLDGFDPRRERDAKKFAELVATVAPGRARAGPRDPQRGR